MDDNGSKLTLFKDKTNDLDNFTFGRSNKISLNHNLGSMLYRKYISVFVPIITLGNNINIRFDHIQILSYFTFFGIVTPPYS